MLLGRCCFLKMARLHHQDLHCVLLHSVLLHCALLHSETPAEGSAGAAAADDILEQSDFYYVY